MKITIEKRNNGIHNTMQIDAQDIQDKDDIDILSRIVGTVEQYNAEQVEKA